MLQPTLFNTIFVFPILNLLLLFYSALQSISIPGAFGFAIILLTVVIRLALHPFFKKQIVTAKKMQELKPHIDTLQKKHKKDPKTLQQEQLKLYKEAGINPASGCLLVLLQMPIFIALYTTLSTVLSNGDNAIKAINNVAYHTLLHVQHIDPWFLGINLAASPQNDGQWFYYAVPVITAVLQYWQVSVSMPATPAKAIEVKEEKKEGDKKDDAGDFQKAMNMQMKYIFPIMIGWFSLSLPIGLSLYWNVFSIFSIIQYTHVHKNTEPLVVGGTSSS